jgi:hypothetical protein
MMLRLVMLAVIECVKMMPIMLSVVRLNVVAPQKQILT